MRVLLHSCCAPCTTFPLFFLRSTGFSVDCVFLNPNIHPDVERDRRLSAYLGFAREENLPVLEVSAEEASHERWLSSVSRELSKPGRCRLCYLHRIIPVARLAKEEGYDCFTTSLLISIYQDHEAVIEACLEASRQADVPFLYRDFRVGYRRSREMARGRHMYMQKYCGCEFSAEETRG